MLDSIDGKTGLVSHRTVDWFAKKLGRKRRSVQTGLAQLESAGWFCAQKRRGKGKANIYRPAWSKCANLCASTPVDSAHDCAHQEAVSVQDLARQTPVKVHDHAHTPAILSPASVFDRQILDWLASNSGRSEANVRAWLGKTRQSNSDVAILDAIGIAQSKQAAEPISYINAVLKNAKTSKTTGNQRRRTGVEGRFFQKVTQGRGVQAFILTHAQAATDNLFGMAARFLEHLPPALRPHTGAANAKELYFDHLDSGFTVATAGAKGAGRASTIQLFHGSEVAHWVNSAEHAAGALQAVPNVDGTEVVLESTANGVGGLFYDMAMAAQRGESEYQLIFLPWFWHDEYRTKPPENWTAPGAFTKYGDAHKLKLEQLFWAYQKNAELAQACGGSPDEPCWLFRQEFPATASEAFQLSGHESFIRGELALAARKAELLGQSKFPLIFGVDIARGGRDKTRIVDRRGRCAGQTVDETIDSDDLMDVAGRLVRLIDRHGPDAVFIDSTGLGAGVYDRLRELGYKNVHSVNFGSKALDDQRYANRRAEMWGTMQVWFSDAVGADIPDSDEWQASLCAPGCRFDSSSRLLLEKKEDIRQRVGFSPGAGDALALTFADPVEKIDMRKINPLRRTRGRGETQGGYSWLGH